MPPPTSTTVANVEKSYASTTAGTTAADLSTIAWLKSAASSGFSAKRANIACQPNAGRPVCAGWASSVNAAHPFVPIIRANERSDCGWSLRSSSRSWRVRPSDRNPP